MKPHKYLLLIVFLTALFLRLYRIEEVPACMNWDEAAFGYNAFSVLETGKDEYGTLLPIEFKSVGDYKLPGYIYMMVPIIKIIDLSVFSVRFLPAFLGAVSIFPMYFLTKRLTKSAQIALLAAFFLAISPWHLQFTRAGADVGVSTFFTISGIFLFIRALQEKQKNFILPAIFFSIGLYTYFSDRVFIPIFIIVSCLYFFRELIMKRLKIVLAILFSFIILAPLAINLFSAGQAEKLTKTSVLGLSRSDEYVSDLKSKDTLTEITLFHSQTLEKALGIFERYLTHFSPQFLFSYGANYDLRQMIYGMGVMYLYDLPLLLIGALVLIKKKDKFSCFVFLWLFLSPIPAAITRDPVHARRSINMLYPLLIISSIGAAELINWVKTKKQITKAFWMFLMIATFVFCTWSYVMSYYIFTPKRVLKGPAGFNCGYKELVEFINPIKEKYDKIVVDTDYQGPYLYFLFYNKYPPEKYQSQAKLIQSSPNSLGEGAGINNIEFRNIYWPDDRGAKNTLFAGSPDSLPIKDVEETGKIIKKIYFYNGEVAFYVVETGK